MFRNYQELFSSAVQYYQTSLFSDTKRLPKPMNIYLNLSNEVSSSEMDYSFDLASKNLYLGVEKAFVLSSYITDEYEKTSTNIINGIYDGLNLQDLLYIASIFILFIVTKRFLSQSLQTSNMIVQLGLRQKDRERLDECVWRLLFYSLSSSWLIYSCFVKHHAQHYFNPDAIISEYSRTMNQDEYLICLIEISFYLHATYAIIVEDVWRKDTPMMMIHHLAAICSILTIYATRTHKIGLTVVVLRDTCDVLLEVTKLAMCLRIQHEKVVKAFDRSVKFFMIIFTTAFVVNQLYYYPLFCLYHAFNFIRMYRVHTPAITVIITCGLIFLILDLLWSLLIAKLLYRMIFTNAPLKDLREYDDETLSSRGNKIRRKKVQ